MAISMYKASVPVFLQTLGALSGVLSKASTWAAGKKIDETVLAQTRLIPDMFSLARQVQTACDFAKNTTARLASVEIPRHEDNESTLEELIARIAKTVAFLKTIEASRIDGSEDKTISMPIGGQTMTFQGEQYLLHFALPNFYFHATTAYVILRASGLEVGKRDFLGGL